MKARLDPKWVEFLGNFPENGMGYQVVNLLLKDGRKLIERTVLNGRLLMVGDQEDLNLNDIEQIEWVKDRKENK